MNKVSAAVLIVLLLALALPAAASHVSEPTEPITAVSMALFDYQTQQSPLACDDSDVVTFAVLQVDLFVEAATAPSEHWISSFDVRHAAQSPGSWTMTWPHQNTAPHGPTGGRFALVRQVLAEGGWQFTLDLTGQESGNKLQATCNFIVAPPSLIE